MPRHIEIFEIQDLLKEAQQKNNQFQRFVEKENVVTGILQLSPGEKDLQKPHADDELYYILKGKGILRVKDEDIPVQSGQMIFVPATYPHYFHGNKEELQVLYMFLGDGKDA